MSVVSLAQTASSSVTVDVLHDVAEKNGIKIQKENEEAYLLALQSADVIASSIDQLPEHIDPRLAPVPTESPRKWWKSPQNSHNAWSHVAEIRAQKPLSRLLQGRKVLIKDNISVAGLPFTSGMLPEMLSKDGTYPVSEIDAPVVRRLLEASATVLGTSTCENYCMTPLSFTSANGPVHNPWLRNYNAGGSTSGGACLLALGVARAAGVSGLETAGEDIDLALGGDQACSIRLPASFCGVYGIKPTHGLVPYTAISGLHPMIDHAGPMARNLEDLALTLTVLAGYDGLDSRMTAESPLRENVKQYHEELAAFTSDPSMTRNLKIGIISESLSSPGTSVEVANVVREAAIKHFSAAGAKVSEVSVPMHLIGPAIWTVATRPSMADLTLKTRIPDYLTHSMPHFAPYWPPDQKMYELMTHFNPAIVNVLLQQTFVDEKFSSRLQAKAHRHVFQLRAAYDKALEEFDVLVTPTVPVVAPPLPDMRPEAEGGSPVLDKIKLTAGLTNNTCPFNISGHPAISVPCGWAAAQGGEGKLPVGMQIIGKRWDDMTVLKAAKAFEIRGGGLGPWPGSKSKATGSSNT